MSTHHCEECWAVLDPAKILRCTKCKACRYCSRECQTRNWRLHKRVCSTNPALRRFMPVEMAVERVLNKCRKVQAPKDATCYICLEGDDGGKLMRGCACRGDSAGFVHIKCLTELAISKEASGDRQVVFKGWTSCGNCKQLLQSALQLEMSRRFWRHYRSGQDLGQRYTAVKCVASLLGLNGEVDAANQLLDAASSCVEHDKEALLDLKVLRAGMLVTNGQNLEALGLLQAMAPEAKEYTANPHYYGLTMLQKADVLLRLGRYQEAHEVATEVVAIVKAKFDLEDPKTLSAMSMYARACAKLGRVEEAKANFNHVLTTQTRVLGRDHPQTQDTRQNMKFYGFAEPSG